MKKIRFAVLILAAAAAAPALAVGVRIDPDGAPAAISPSPAQFLAQLTGSDNADRGWGIDPNG